MLLVDHRFLRFHYVQVEQYSQKGAEVRQFYPADFVVQESARQSVRQLLFGFPGFGS